MHILSFDKHYGPKNAASTFQHQAVQNALKYFEISLVQALLTICH